MQCSSQTVQLQTNGGAHWHGDKSQQCIICDTRFEHISGSTGSSICKSVIPIPAMMYACKDQEEAITVLPLWRGSYIHQSNEKAQVIQPQIVFFICASCGKQITHKGIYNPTTELYFSRVPHVANTFAQEISVRHVAKTFTQAHITNQIKSKHITLFFLSVPSVANTPPQDHI